MKLKSQLRYRVTTCIIFALLALNVYTALAQNEVGKIRRDSLYAILQSAKTPAEKLPVLNELTTLCWQREEECSLNKEIVDLALQVDSFTIAYNAMAALSQYYYDINITDSLLYWHGMIDMIAGRRNEFPDALFISGSFVLQDYLWTEDYELAMNDAIRLADLARKENKEYGLLRSYHCLGLIYQVLEQDSNAVAAFREGLDFLNKNTNHRRFEMLYLRDMVVSTLRLNLFDETESLLKRYEKLLEKFDEAYETKGQFFPSARSHCFLDAYFCELYTRAGQLKKAREHLDKATRLVSKEMDDYVEYIYYEAEALYYMTIKDYRKAMIAIDNALELERSLNILGMKMTVLRETGHLKGAIDVYNEMLEMNSSINKKAFDRQIAQLRTLNDLNDSEKQARELNLQKEQIASKQRLLIYIWATIVVLLILAFCLYRLYRRTYRLQKDLLYEKDLLIESEKQLRKMKEKAEEANRMKTAFISNISHEVRTPLNAIVGFSELLVDDSFPEEEKQFFASTINRSSELLMNLINDVLDLSRLESGNYKFSIKEWDIVVLCREFIADRKQKCTSGVTLTGSFPVESYLLKTDRFWLLHLLGHLLSNAMKFTRQGEVNLSFGVDEEGGFVRFYVTDTGCGIPLEMQKKIFERFEKLNEFEQGTGLGLAICRIIAEQFGGILYIDSSYTKGARMVFAHPCNLKKEN